jgi:hypothetical protein
MEVVRARTRPLGGGEGGHCLRMQGFEADAALSVLLARSEVVKHRLQLRIDHTRQASYFRQFNAQGLAHDTSRRVQRI